MASRAQRLPPDAKTVVIAAKHADAESLAHALQATQAALGLDAFIVAHGRTNSLIVAAADDASIHKIEGLIEALDQPVSMQRPPAGDDQDVWRGVALTSADAREVAHILEELTGGRRRAVRIMPQLHANAIWLAGPAADVDRLAQAAAQMDEGAATFASRGPDTQRTLHFFTLKHAICAPLAATVNDVAQLMGLDVKVIADQQSNTLIAYATAAQVEHLETVINRLDADASGQPARAPRGSRTDSDQ